MIYIMMILIGIVGGLASGLFGVGGGTIFVPAMILILKMNPHVSIGTSLAIVVPTAIAGAFFHNQSHMVDWKMVFAITAFAILGAWLGSRLSVSLDEQLLRKSFAVFMILVALRLFVKG